LAASILLLPFFPNANFTTEDTPEKAQAVKEEPVIQSPAVVDEQVPVELIESTPPLTEEIKENSEPGESEVMQELVEDPSTVEAVITKEKAPEELSDLPTLTMPDSVSSDQIRLPITLPTQLFSLPIQLSPKASFFSSDQENQVVSGKGRVRESFSAPEQEIVEETNPEIILPESHDTMESAPVISTKGVMQSGDDQDDVSAEKEAVGQMKESVEKIPAKTPEFNSSDPAFNGSVPSQMQMIDLPQQRFSLPIRLSAPVAMPQRGVNNATDTRQGNQ